MGKREKQLCYCRPPTQKIIEQNSTKPDRPPVTGFRQLGLAYLHPKINLEHKYLRQHNVKPQQGAFSNTEDLSVQRVRRHLENRLFAKETGALAEPAQAEQRPLE